MFAYIVFGATYAFACAVQPGPLQTYIVSQALGHGWRRALPAALSPVLSDGPIALLALLVLTRIPPHFASLVRLAGGCFLLYLAWRALNTWREYRGLEIEGGAASPARSVLSAAVVNLLNPNPYLGWSLVMGPMLLKGWRESPGHGIALVVSFYATMVVSLGAIIIVFAAARSLGPRISRTLVLVSGLALAGFGVWQLWAGTAMLVGS
jgi:threonine/homoserine/homoserine lactone efflux protein